MQGRKLFLIGLAVFLLAVASTGLASADTLVRDEWTLATQEGKPVGFGHDQFWETDSGYKYVSDSVIQLVFLGSEPAKLTQHIEMETDKQYRARTLNMLLDINGSTTQFRGSFETNDSGTTAEIITVNADGEEFRSTWQKDFPLYFSSSFIDRVVENNGLTVGKEYEENIWNLAGAAPAKAIFRVKAKETYEYKGKEIQVYRVELETGNQVIEALIDREGWTYEAYEPAQNLTLKKVAEDEIPELESMTVDALIVPGNRKVAHPLRSTSSTIRVGWEEVPFADFSFEDNRQQLIEHRRTGTKEEVLLKISKDTRDFTGKTTLPVENEFLEKYLGKTRFIDPTLPEVQKLAREILEGEADGWKATQKLVSWVFDFIEPKMVPETLTTEQILERKSGKCVEYAVLFASLARAAGLPTRLALGDRYMNNAWVGHMWNEVWLGEWVAVDPSHNQVAPDALLVKFVDSPDVMGTQSVRTGLIGRLQITIDAVEVPEDKVTAELKTGIVGQTYTNADYSCRLSAPEGWNITETEQQGLPMLVMQPKSKPLGSAVLVMASVPAGTKPKQVMASRIPALKSALPEFSLVGEEKGKINDYPAAIGTWTFTQQNQSFRQQNWIVVDGDRCYLFVFTALTDAWGQYEEIFSQIRSSFNVIK